MGAEPALWPDGGGEMGEMIRLHDWSASPLGTIRGWPDGLRTAVCTMLGTRNPVALTWGPELIVLYNDGCAGLMGPDMHPGILGKPAAAWPRSQEIGSAEVQQVLNSGESAGQESRMIPVRRGGMLEDAWWTYSRTPIHDQQSPNGVGGALMLFTETTAQERAERGCEVRFQSLEARFRIAREAAQLGLFDVDMKSGECIWDARIRNIWGVAPDELITDQVFMAGVHPDDRNAVTAALALATAPESSGDYRAEYRVIQRGTGSICWLMATGRAFFDQGQAVRLVGTVQDISERKRSEEKIRLLMAEVNHRSKNLLAVVQSIAHQTSAKGSPRSFALRFSERLQGLAASHDLLVGNAWQGVDLVELVASQLAHFRDLVRERIHFDGPTLQLRPAAAQALGMALHELATNAGKYGSLSSSAGEVDISWYVTDGEGELRFHMDWREFGGPPVVAPVTSGFGTKLIAHMTEIALQGQRRLDYDRGGVAWSIDAPLCCITPAHDEEGGRLGATPNIERDRNQRACPAFPCP